MSDCASTGFCGSSIMKMSPPKPVRVPYTDVDRRNPRAVVQTSSSRLREIRIFGNARRYHDDSTIERKSLACFDESSLP
jgi:hypothetical protein